MYLLCNTTVSSVTTVSTVTSVTSVSGEHQGSCQPYQVLPSSHHRRGVWPGRKTSRKATSKQSGNSLPPKTKVPLEEHATLRGSTRDGSKAEPGVWTTYPREGTCSTLVYL